MGRPRKQTADWFPHYVTDSRTKFILEDGWGNNGYAFWFKLLELLCKSDGHNYDCSNKANMKYLVALTKVDEGTATEILNTLADMEKIDRQLWEQHQIIWCQSLVDNLSTMYSKRTVSAPAKPFLDEFPNRKPPGNDVTSDRNPHNTLQDKTLQDKTLHNIKESVGASNQEKLQPGESLTVKMAGMAAGEEACEEPSKTLAAKRFEKFWTTYPKKAGKKAAEAAWKKIKPDTALYDKIIIAIGKARVTEQWTKENGRFIPNPTTWLNQGRWDDEYEEVTQPHGVNSKHFDGREQQQTATQGALEYVMLLKSTKREC